MTEYTLTNKNNLVVKCIEYGKLPIVSQIHVAYKWLICGCPRLQQVDGQSPGHPYFGSNAGGRCAIDEKSLLKARDTRL